MKRNYILIPIGGGGKKIELSPLTVTENGVYTADEDKGYNEVSVSVADIPAVTEPLNVTENGTYTPSSGVDGFSEVSVNVPDIPAVTEPLNITENGVYTPSSGVDGFSEVSVNVPDIPAVTEPLNVTENGTYTTPEGVDGYNTVSVNVPQASVVSKVNSVDVLDFTSLQVNVYIVSNQTITSYGVDYSTDNFQTYQSVTNDGDVFGEKQYTIANLTSGTTYQIRSFVVIDSIRYDQEPYTTITTGITPAYPERIPTNATKMTTTDLGSSLTVTMGYGSTKIPNENFYIDWGDGSDIQLYVANTSAEVSHTYSETGNKTIYCWSDSTTDTEYGKMPPFKSSSGYDSWLQIESIETPLQNIYGGSTNYNANNLSNNSMFYSAKQLKTVCSNLFENYCDPTKRLGQAAFASMFRGCTSLTTAPELPATMLYMYCYQYMFYGCTSLTTAPALPSKSLAMECYLSMFQDCTSLTTAPVLPATTLASSCYSSMFRGCSALQSVTTYVTSWNTSNTAWWLTNAGTNAENPTIYCPANSTLKNYTDNNSGIPTGWTQVDLTE